MDAIVKARANAFASCNILCENRTVAAHKLAEHWRNQRKEFVRRAKKWLQKVGTPVCCNCYSNLC